MSDVWVFILFIFPRNVEDGGTAVWSMSLDVHHSQNIFQREQENTGNQNNTLVRTHIKKDTHQVPRR